MSAIIEGAIGWAVGRLGDAVFKPIQARLGNRAAKAELTQIAERCVEAAVIAAPALAEDLRSEPFQHNVAAPLLLSALAHPAEDFGGEDLARGYVERFVAPFLTGPSATETLKRVFQTTPEEIAAAFEAFVARFRAELLASSHWRAPMETRLHAETHEGVARLQRDMAVLLEHVAQGAAPPLTADGGLAAAQEDAQIGSEALNGWPRDIAGQLIERPEIDTLITRIRAHPGGRTLVVGEPGLGKSALLAELSARLQAQGMTVFAIKADQLDPDVRNMDEVAADLGLSGDLEAELVLLARSGPLVILIDQLDAVSEVMDQSGRRMRLLLRLAKLNDLDRSSPPVHVVVSSRPFEAEHDGRFQTLGAEKVELAPPSLEQVEALLTALSVPAPTSAAMAETLRRPFALKLYVDIHRRGAPVQGLLASELLSAWLAAAQLGEGDQRRRTLALMTQLAADMTRAESLWRPLDLYLEAEPQAVRLGQAAGLLLIHDGKLGFSHQAWLDDFQARSLASLEDLCAFVWARQDGLFCRATVLRALQRLRQFDASVYVQALDRLLLDERTRRHIRHLVVEQLAGQAAPLPREVAWLAILLESDPPLARRAMARTLAHWSGWREHLLPRLPGLMGEAGYRWAAINYLQAEAKLDLDGVLDLIEAHWRTSALATIAFEALRDCRAWTPRLEALIVRLFDLNLPPDHRVLRFGERLAAAGNGEAAARLVRLYADRMSEAQSEQADFHRLDQLAVQVPAEVTRALWPWLLDYAQDQYIATHRYFVRYGRIGRRLRDVEHPRAGGGLVGGLIKAMTLLARQDPPALLELLRPGFLVEIDSVQALIAEVLIEAGCALAEASLDYLLGDPRRLSIGYVVDDNGVPIEGYVSMQLVAAIAPCLAPETLGRLVAAIEAWEPFSEEARTEKGPDVRLERRAWTEERRLALLEQVPQTALTPRRQRQVLDWRKAHPSPRLSVENPMGLKAARSPLSAEQMAKAADRDILRVLDRVADETEGGWGRRWRPDGSVVELGRAFAAFGLAYPQRALTIAEQALVAGRQEYVGGELVAQLAQKHIEPQRVHALIRRQVAAGFSSSSWRGDAARALAALAEPLGGLDDDDLALLESWLEAAPSPGPDDDEDDEPKARGRQGGPQAMLFGPRGGLQVVPGGNVTILTALAEGLGAREIFVPDRLIGLFQRHLERGEAASAWAYLIGRYGAWLLDGDAEGVADFFTQLLEHAPKVYDALAIRNFLWVQRAALPEGLLDGVLLHWRASERTDLRRLAGEFLGGLFLLDEASGSQSDRARGMWTTPGPERVGGIFAAATAWREEGAELGAAAEAILLPRCVDAEGDEVHAIASALGYRKGGWAGARVERLLRAVAANPAVLAACQAYALGDFLQELLLQPGAEGLVLEVAEAGARVPGGEDAGGLLDEDLVHITVALQRNDGPLRARAMTLYETLLDRAAHEAEAAAMDALRS